MVDEHSGSEARYLERGRSVVAVGTPRRWAECQGYPPNRRRTNLTEATMALDRTRQA